MVKMGIILSKLVSEREQFYILRYLRNKKTARDYYGSASDTATDAAFELHEGLMKYNIRRKQKNGTESIDKPTFRVRNNRKPGIRSNSSRIPRSI